MGARLTLISQLRLLATTLDFDNSSSLKCDYAAALIAVAKYDEALKEHVSVLLVKWSTQMSKSSSPTVSLQAALKFGKLYESMYLLDFEI